MKAELLTKSEKYALYKYSCTLMKFMGARRFDAQGILQLIAYVLRDISVKEGASRFEVYAKARKALSYKILGHTGRESLPDAVAGAITREELKNLLM